MWIPKKGDDSSFYFLSLVIRYHISSSCWENVLLWGKQIPSPKPEFTGKNHKNLVSPNTSWTLFIVPKWNPRLSGTKFGRKMGARNDSRVVWFLVTRYKWYPNNEVTEMQNIPLTKNRNKIWNLKQIEYHNQFHNIQWYFCWKLFSYRQRIFLGYVLAALESLSARWPIQQKVLQST